MRTSGLLRHTLERVRCLAHKAPCRLKLGYAVEVWDTFLAKHIEMLEAVQNRAVCFIGNLRGQHGVTIKKEALGLEPLADRRKGKRMSMLHYILNQPV